MKKNFNFKNLNILITLMILYVLYLLKDVWLGIFEKVIIILLPFIIGFLIAYVLYPLLKYLVNKKIPKTISIAIIFVLIISIISLTLYLTLPVFYTQLLNLLENLSQITSDLTNKYNIKISNNLVDKYTNIILKQIENYVSSGSFISFISKSVDYISKVIIITVVSIYFLSDMKNIREKIASYLKKSNNKRYEMLKKIDIECTSYLKGIVIFMLIQFVEYSLLFFLIGHPNFLLIGVLACVTTIIPYFGGLITNIIALIIASVVSTKVFVLSLIITLVFPNIDGYLISPKIYGKTNQMPSLLTIFAVFAGGVLFGFVGIIIAVPLAIIIMSIIKAYKDKIECKLNKIKNKN